MEESRLSPNQLWSLAGKTNKMAHKLSRHTCIHVGYYTLVSAISDIHALSPRVTGPRARSVYIGYCTSGGVITCLSLLKPYCACTQHAVAQCYCIISKSPRGKSKPESTSRVEASKTQVTTQPFCPWRRQPSYQKDVCDCHWKKSFRRCTNRNVGFVDLLLYAWKLGQKEWIPLQC